MYLCARIERELCVELPTLLNKCIIEILTLMLNIKQKAERNKYLRLNGMLH